MTHDAVNNKASLIAERILADNAYREDFFTFIDVPARSRVQLPHMTDEEKAVADSVIRRLRQHDSEQRVCITDNNQTIVIEGPYSVFEAAHAAACGRSR